MPLSRMIQSKQETAPAGAVAVSGRLRLRCVVPGCGRTIPPEEPDDTACICSRHWSQLDPRRRSAYRRRRRAIRAIRNKAAETQQMDDTMIEAQRKNLRAASRLWRSLARQAIERAVGI